MKLHENTSLFSTLATAVENERGISRSFVEKDYWLTSVLHALSQSPHSSMTVFKGGTSLSKAWNLIERFSEDVDIALIAEGLTGNQVKTRMDAISKAITRHVPEVHIEHVTSKGSKFRRTAHVYEPLFMLPEGTEVATHLIFEFNTFANPYPFEERQITSFIGEFLSGQGRQDLLAEYGLEPFSLQVLSPKRTIAEKTLALARASYTSDIHTDPVETLRTRVRHLYDIFFLLQDSGIASFVASEAFFQTLSSVKEDDSNHHEFQGAWAKQPLTAAMIYQDKPELWEQLKGTYQGSFKTMVYGTLPSLDMVRMTFQKFAERLRSFDDWYVAK